MSFCTLCLWLGKSCQTSVCCVCYACTHLLNQWPMAHEKPGDYIPLGYLSI